MTNFRHKQAYTFAKQAVKKLKVVVEDGIIYTGVNKQVASKNIIATAVIAHYNAGVESEFMRKWSEAKFFYEIG